ncbi:MAG: pantetheine-phosphate adenylyltransferase [Acidimicrobiia bacterium]|nr:pantetheine-phosphate adenylyltransferase [Acidimicrobiia bacterium]
MVAALIPGSFDPPTNGHLDVIERCAGLFDRVLVAVVRNPAKAPMFSSDERVAMLTECTEHWPNVAIGSFSGLLVDYAEEENIDVIVKGLRAMTDFDYEFQMSQMNRHLSGIVTLFVATKPEYGYLSSSLVKQVAGLGGSIDKLVPPLVATAIEKRVSNE